MNVAPTAPPPRRSLTRAAAATALACAILVLLGAWQLQRLAWKKALIARIAARTHAAPEPLPPESAWAGLDPEDYAYRPVRFEAMLERDRNALVFRPAGGSSRQPGYLVLTPARLSSGAYVIVNRGFAPAAMKDRIPGGSGEERAQIVGLMREPEARNVFTPADNPQTGAFFTRDPAPIAARFGLARVAPFTVDAERDAAAPTNGLEGGATELAFPNNHLAYAFTWFGLALALLAVFAVYAARGVAQGRDGR